MSKRDLTSSILSQRYAKALFDLAIEANQLTKIEEDILYISDLFEQDEDIKNIFINPCISRKHKEKMVLKLSEKLGCHELTSRFLLSCSRKDRLGILISIAARFKVLAQEYRQELPAEITSASQLGASQVTALKEMLKQKFNREIVISTMVNPEILGGVVIKIASLVIDNSLRAKLDRITRSVKLRATHEIHS